MFKEPVMRSEIQNLSLNCNSVNSNKGNEINAGSRLFDQDMISGSTDPDAFLLNTFLDASNTGLSNAKIIHIKFQILSYIIKKHKGIPVRFNF
ncbi:MAG: hypothetical protein Kow0098_09690 [Ignavibacteriaceae bacterium]